MTIKFYQLNSASGIDIRTATGLTGTVLIDVVSGPSKVLTSASSDMSGAVAIVPGATFRSDATLYLSGYSQVRVRYETDILPIADLPAKLEVDINGNTSAIRSELALSKPFGISRGSRAPTPMVGDITLPGDIVAIAGTPTITLVTGPNGKPAYKIVTNGSAFCEINFPQLLNAAFGGDMFLSIDTSFAGGTNTISAYATPDASFATNFAVSTFSSFSGGGANGTQEQGGAWTLALPKSTFSITGTITYPFNITTHKIRITPRAAMTATVYIYGIGLSNPQPKGRICVVADDGYDSWFGLGQPIFDARSIPVTVGVIPVAMNIGSNFAYMRQLRAHINHGNAIVAHGPNLGTGANNLLTVYPGDTPAQVNDMIGTRQWIADNGLGVAGYEYCYVWPQGTFQTAYGDMALLDAAYTAGFTTGRNANTLSAGLLSNFDALSKYQRLCMPIIGHTWAGTTAAEATNITAIVTAINAAAAAGTDVFLMLHRVQPTATADGSMSSIGIRSGDLTTIADAIQTKVNAGTLTAVTMPQLAISKGGFWAQ